jgi:hypothetical protein
MSNYPRSQRGPNVQAIARANQKDAENLMAIARTSRGQTLIRAKTDIADSHLPQAFKDTHPEIRKAYSGAYLNRSLELKKQKDALTKVSIAKEVLQKQEATGVDGTSDRAWAEQQEHDHPELHAQGWHNVVRKEGTNAQNAKKAAAASHDFMRKIEKNKQITLNNGQKAKLGAVVPENERLARTSSPLIGKPTRTGKISRGRHVRTFKLGGKRKTKRQHKRKTKKHKRKTKKHKRKTKKHKRKTRKHKRTRK